MTTNTTELSPNETTIPSECLVLQAQKFIPWNNSDNIVSLQTEQLARNMQTLVFLPITFLIGVPANILNMAVFYKQGLKERINVCLFALSLADALYLVVTMVSYAEQIYLHFTTKETYGPILRWIINKNLLGFWGFKWVSQVLSSIVASERCFCVLQPLKSQIILRTSTMTAIIVVVFVVVIGGRFIVTTRYYIVCAYDPVSDRTIMAGGVGEFYRKHKKLVDFVTISVYGIGIPWVVMMVAIVTTAITVIKLRQAAEWRAGMSSSSGSVSARDIALTRMLVGNSIFFIVCVIPHVLFSVLQLCMPEMHAGRRLHNLYGMALWLVNIFSYINSAFNIVVYYTMGSRFRHTVCTLLGRKITKDTPPAH